MPLGSGNEARMLGFFLPHGESPSAGGEASLEQGRTQMLARGSENRVCLMPIPAFLLVFPSVKMYLGFVFIGNGKIHTRSGRKKFIHTDP